ncbi:hypothetical protein [Desulfovirgula thermocuniculi]|uniref:hypothetical protein n=1 Tax=Desulfovirgula thermocuniculi TaxID=348842 RepID=UPI0004838A80|nr:hypothetical protein [Desulfovirgula thermocuniculi]
MREKREKLSISLPPSQAKALRRLAAEMHAPVSGLVALAVERFLEERGSLEVARRAELFARAALWGVAELLSPGSPRDAARRLVAEAREQLRRMEGQVRQRDGKAPGAGEGADGKAGAEVAAPAGRQQA